MERVKTSTGSHIEIRTNQHCAVVWLNGANAMENLTRCANEIAAHPDWTVDFDIIVVIGLDSDLNDVTLDKLVAHQSFVAEWSSLHRTGPNSQAAIVCSDELKQVIVELWLAVSRLANRVEDRIFLRLEDALTAFTRPGDA